MLISPSFCRRKRIFGCKIVIEIRADWSPGVIEPQAIGLRTFRTVEEEGATSNGPAREIRPALANGDGVSCRAAKTSIRAAATTRTAIALETGEDDSGCHGALIPLAASTSATNDWVLGAATATSNDASRMI